MMTAFLFDGHIRNIVNLDYDIFIVFTISAGLELPADLLSIVCIEQERYLPNLNAPVTIRIILV
jgi:hypothetical protein